MDSIYSLTVRILEKFFSKNQVREDVLSLANALSRSDFKKGGELSAKLIYESGLDINDDGPYGHFKYEMEFASGICEYMQKNYEQARRSFMASLKYERAYPYASLFLARIAEAEGRNEEALSYIAGVERSFEAYYYFRMAALRLRLSIQDYDSVYSGTRRLIAEFEAADGELKLLPAVQFVFLDSTVLNDLFKKSFTCADFLFDLLYIAAEAGFNLEKYEAAFEYYKEATSASSSQAVKIECYYKMASCKIRVADLKTAQSLLEKVVETDSVSSGALKYYQGALLDLANIYEFHFADTDSALKILMKYLESAGEDIDAACRAGRMLFDAGRFNEALYYLIKADHSAMSNDAELSLLIARCYFNASMYERSLEAAEKALSDIKSQGISSMADNGYECRTRLLLIKNLLLLERLEKASEEATKLSDDNIDSSIRYECIKIKRFLEQYKMSAIFIVISGFNCENADMNFTATVFRGFLESVSYNEKNAAGLKEKLKERIEGCIIWFSRGAPPELIVETYREFPGVAIICDDHLPCLDSGVFGISLKENPFNCKKMSALIESAAIVVSMFATINMERMPQLFVPDQFAAAGMQALTIHKTGMLLFYKMFAASRQQFELIISYCGVSRIEKTVHDERRVKSLWPFIINFKNIDMSQMTSPGREHYLVYSCDDIFIYNYFRCFARRIEERGNIHIFVPTSKMDHLIQMTEFILKKLEYKNIDMQCYEDISDALCIKKVNSLLASDLSNTESSYNVIMAVIFIGAGFATKSEISKFLNPDLCEKIGFLNSDCDCFNCSEQSFCRAAAYIASYTEETPDRRKVRFSPYSNYHVMTSGQNGSKAFPAGSTFIFCDLPAFYDHSSNFFRKAIDIDALIEFLWKYASETSEPVSGACRAILNAISDFLNCVPEGILSYFNEELFRKLYFNASPFLNEISASGKNISPEFTKFAGACIEYKENSSAAGFDSFISSVGGRREILIRYDNWISKMALGGFAESIYFLHPGEEDDYFEKKFEKALKFFRRINLSSAYAAATGYNANILVLPEYSSEWKSIVKKFSQNNKKIGHFLIDDRQVLSNFDRSEFSPEMPALIIDSATEIEPYLATLDCALINYPTADFEKAKSKLKVLRNIIMKYNVDIFWIIISSVIYESYFTEKTDQFGKTNAVNVFLNEIEYCHSFSGRSENTDFLRSLPEINSYEEVPENYIPDWGTVLIEKQWRSYFKKFWSKNGHLIANGDCRTVLGESDRPLSYILLSICRELALDKQRKNICVYFPDESELGFFEKNLSSILLLAGYTKDQGLQITLIKNDSLPGLNAAFKNIASSGAHFFTFGSSGINFNSLSFQILKYFRWAEFSRSFKNISIFTSVNPVETVFSSEASQGFININQTGGLPAAACGKIPRSRLTLNNIDGFHDIMTNSENGAPALHIICCESLEERNIREMLQAKISKSRDKKETFYIHYERGRAFFKKTLAEKCHGYSSVNIYLLRTAHSVFDSAVFSSAADSFCSASSIKLFDIFIESGYNSRKPAMSLYQSVCYLDLLLKGRNREKIDINSSEIASFMPIGVFSHAAASRALAVLAESGRISLSETEGQAYFNRLNITRETFLALKKSGAVETLSENDFENENVIDVASGLISGKFIIKNEDDFIDKVSRESENFIKISIGLRASFDEGIKNLKKASETRKIMLACLYDIEGYSSGQWVSLPFLDNRTFSYNDYYYAREICPLIWHSICEIKRMGGSDPAIRPAGKSGNVEYKSERISDSLVEIFAALQILNTRINLDETAVGLDDIVAILVEERRKSGAATKSEIRPSYVLKLLRQLFLYGLINLKICSLPRTDGMIRIEPLDGARNIDYKSFLEACNSIARRCGTL
ncbi:MAG TPA: hypothetical protein PKK26_08680 [Candidatus Wallbacteria bacterium]|nr:hypothetical protein [Candidatus Wallbacteria bacterium]